LHSSPDRHDNISLGGKLDETTFTAHFKNISAPAAPVLFKGIPDSGMNLIGVIYFI